MPAYLINEELAGNRLDKFVCEKLEISRNLCKKWIEEGYITVNNKTSKGSYTLKLNE